MTKKTVAGRTNDLGCDPHDSGCDLGSKTIIHSICGDFSWFGIESWFVSYNSCDSNYIGWKLKF